MYSTLCFWSLLSGQLVSSLPVLDSFTPGSLLEHEQTPLSFPPISIFADGITNCITGPQILDQVSECSLQVQSEYQLCAAASTTSECICSALTSLKSSCFSYCDSAIYAEAFDNTIQAACSMSVNNNATHEKRGLIEVSALKEFSAPGQLEKLKKLFNDKLEEANKKKDKSDSLATEEIQSISKMEDDTVEKHLPLEFLKEMSSQSNTPVETVSHNNQLADAHEAVTIPKRPHTVSPIRVFNYTSRSNLNEGIYQALEPTPIPSSELYTYLPINTPGPGDIGEMPHIEDPYEDAPESMRPGKGDEKEDTSASEGSASKGRETEDSSNLDDIDNLPPKQKMLGRVAERILRYLREQRQGHSSLNDHEPEGVSDRDNGSADTEGTMLPKVPQEYAEDPQWIPTEPGPVLATVTVEAGTQFLTAIETVVEQVVTTQTETVMVTTPTTVRVTQTQTRTETVTQTVEVPAFTNARFRVVTATVSGAPNASSHSFGPIESGLVQPIANLYALNSTSTNSATKIARGFTGAVALGTVSLVYLLF